MDRLNNINSYFNQKERSRLNELVKNAGGLPTMSKDEIRLSCIENDGYEAPELNDKLYLHFRGFKRIENLDEYTSCKAIWLDSNGFEVIENLEHMPLRCLYLSKNLINKIQGLDAMKNLATLDLSNNRITIISGLEGCISLKTINLSRNALASADALEGLLACPSIDNIDITNNQIEGDVTSVLSKLPTLHALSINGNPCTQSQGFRKRTIAAIPTLSYLDRPVDEIEKVGAHAYVTEGPEKEQEVRMAFIAKQKQQRSDELNQFRTWQREQLALRKERIESGDTSGLHFITEFTPEELAQREAEAQKAADLEKEMLDMGIGKLGQKYWQMQGRDEGNADGIEILEKAVEELKESKKRQAQVEEEYQNEVSIDTDDVRVEIVDDSLTCNDINDIDEDDVLCDDINDIDESDESEINDEGGFHKVQIEEDDECDLVDEVNKENEEVDAKSDNIIVQERRDSPNNSIEECSGVELHEDGNDEPKWVHQQRVQESIEIYNRQRQQEKMKKESTSQQRKLPADHMLNPPVDSFSSTQTVIDWNFEINTDNISDSEGKVYWTEWMDLKLAELVQTCVYDFEAIADSFTELASSDEFSQLPPISFGVGKHTREVLEELSAENCRVRWAELDAKQWCDTDENGDSNTLAESTAPAVYKVCVKPDVLGKGHGAQPTFAAMSNMATGIPSYLKVPTSFPSMSDDDEDESNEVYRPETQQ